MARTRTATKAPSRDVVTITGAGSYRTDIEAGGFDLVADEPGADGAAGAGPNPYDYLLAALGACTGMTLRMYATRKQWPLESVTVTLRHGRAHAVDCEHCEEPGSNLAHVQREIALVGVLDETQRTRLMQIADMCPVHRSLAAGFHISSTLVAIGATGGEGTPAPSRGA